MNELNPAQCYQFLLAYNGVRTINAGRFWAVVDLEHDGDTREAAIPCTHPTPEAAITAYWQKYHRKDWTPPEIHDAETALEYFFSHRMMVNNIAVWKPQTRPEQLIWLSGGAPPTVEKFVDAISQFKAKHDPDKPEETAIGLLKELREFIPIPELETSGIIKRVDDHLKEADRA